MLSTTTSSCASSSICSRALKKAGMIPVTRPPWRMTDRALSPKGPGPPPAKAEAKTTRREDTSKVARRLDKSRVAARARAAIDADIPKVCRLLHGTHVPLWALQRQGSLHPSQWRLLARSARVRHQRGARDLALGPRRLNEDNRRALRPGIERLWGKRLSGWVRWSASAPSRGR